MLCKMITKCHGQKEAALKGATKPATKSVKESEIKREWEGNIVGGWVKERARESGSKQWEINR